MRAAIYTRVSTDHQTTDNQLNELRAVAERAGWVIVTEYTDNGVSGAKDSRPAFDQLKKAAKRREFDVVLAWSVDRIGRSLQGLVAFLDELHALNIDLYLHQQGIDTTTPSGKAMFQMCGVFAEFERALIQERVKAGLQRARRQGKRLGRPRISPATERAIKVARNQGRGIKAIASELQVGIGTVQRVIGSNLI